MITKVKINEIQGASYNPRYLSKDAEKELKKSLELFGQIKPIIVRKENNTIVAGHQRTKIMSKLGYNEVDCFFISGVGRQDEVRFNQLHNKCEVEISSLQPKIKVPQKKLEGYVTIKASDINIENSGGLGGIVSELSELIMKYGNFGSCIANYKGEVLVSAIYAKAIKLLNMDLLVYYVQNDKTEICINTFKKDYGVFSYEHLEKKTFVQTLAQMKRLQGTMQLGSTLYKKNVIPYLQNVGHKNMSILDFGSGFGAYAELLRKKGYNVYDIEFYRRKGNNNNIDTAKVKRMLKDIKRHVLDNGLFDIVICDSVLNSVDSLEAEKSVLTCINAFCKKGGIVFWSGRPKDKRDQTKNTIGGTTTMYFTDENLFTANFRNGYWFYQKFHTKEMIDCLNKKYISNTYSLRVLPNTSFQITTKKEHLLSPTDLRKALKFELELPLPNGKYNLYNENIDLIDKIIECNQA